MKDVLKDRIWTMIKIGGDGKGNVKLNPDKKSG